MPVPVFFLISVKSVIVLSPLFFALNILFLTPWWIDFDLESFRDKLFTRKDYGQFELGLAVFSDLTSFATISCAGMLITRIFSPHKYLED